MIDSLQQIAERLGQAAPASWQGQVPRALVLDSRQAGEGDLFLALPGERVDGHAFIPAALQQGAIGAITEQPAADPRCLRVPSAREALEELARQARCEYTGTVLALTGSNGKTTSKELLLGMLGPKRAAGNPGNLNSTIGMPLALVNGLSQAPGIWVQELGASDFGEIARMSALLSPHAGLVTNIAEAHLEAFGDLEGVLRAKSELLRWLAEHGGRVALNTGDIRLRTLVETLPEALCYSMEGGLEHEGRRLRWLGLDEQARGRFRIGSEDCTLAVPGRAFAECWLSAAALALLAGVSDEDLLQAASLDPSDRVAGRMRVIHHRGRIVIDDSYNANPASVRAALATLAAFPVAGRRFAALGYMAELGPREAEWHRCTGSEACRAGVDELLVIGGPVMREVLAGYREAGCGDGLYCHTVKDAARRLAGLRSGDALLVKGSRSAGLDELVREICHG